MNWKIFTRGFAAIALVDYMWIAVYKVIHEIPLEAFFYKGRYLQGEWKSPCTSVYKGVLANTLLVTSGPLYKPLCNNAL